MADTLENTILILEKLVGFKSISGQPTHEIVNYIKNYLSDCNISSSLSFDQDWQRSNLFAIIGPKIDSGIVLNGHMDVVPVIGQK